MECAKYPSSIMLELPTCIFLILKLFWSNQTITRLSDIGYGGELCPGRNRLHPGATIPIWSGYPSVLVVWFVTQRPSAPTKFWGVIRYRPLFGGRPDYARITYGVWGWRWCLKRTSRVIGELAFISRRQWRRWGETVGEAPEARKIIVAETIFVFSV